MKAVVVFIAFLSWGMCHPGGNQKRRPRNGAAAGNQPNISLDILSPDEELVTLKDEGNGDLVYKRMTVKEGKTVNSVAEGETSVWKAADASQKCTSVHFLKKPELSDLLAVYTDKNGTSGSKHFQKNGSGWTAISKTDFDKKLVSMKPPEDNP
ncbi:signal peptide containing protein [Theileria equi strain WA]|uniref:Signal peptide containing protein n=1 Tax=Theileria equi strain WA TaxID=1537102 RepID=L1LB02_THEEQ|nr:signal peptide containing protein [Theileria equi strain WA]EKX72318.1 signal peptide containing protein [Theileria equi strain WA]|eukprot:XP_004831770.1 signal peptide containing protein [Theileria equi strain WA]